MRSEGSEWNISNTHLFLFFCPIRHHGGQRLRQSANGGGGAACGQSVTSRIRNHLSVLRSRAILQEAELKGQRSLMFTCRRDRAAFKTQTHRKQEVWFSNQSELLKMNVGTFFCSVRSGTQHVSPVTSSEQTWVQVLLTCVYKNFNGGVYGSPLVPRRENVNDINKEYCKEQLWRRNETVSTQSQ